MRKQKSTKRERKRERKWQTNTFIPLIECASEQNDTDDMHCWNYVFIGKNGWREMGAHERLNNNLINFANVKRSIR